MQCLFDKVINTYEHVPETLVVTVCLNIPQHCKCNTFVALQEMNQTLVLVCSQGCAALAGGSGGLRLVAGGVSICVECNRCETPRQCHLTHYLVTSEPTTDLISCL